VIALDTNVLLRFAKTTDPQFSVVARAISKLESTGEELCIFPQNVYEFWSTATRPTSANGFGWSVPTARRVRDGLKVSFLLLPDPPGLFDEWESLVVTYQCHGRVSYDARIVAAMNTHALTRLLTFNVPDFARYPGLTVLDPAMV
jgi:predicted nucleic acid-binding protein